MHPVDSEDAHRGLTGGSLFRMAWVILEAAREELLSNSKKIPDYA
jgi:hypothetical protein